MVKRLVFLALLFLAATVAAAPDLLLEAEVEPAGVLVQTQAIYRLRFYQGIDVRALEMVGPSAPLAEIRPIGETRVREAVRDGRRYRVHERAYAVFPFASGRLELAGAHAEGRIAAGGEPAGDARRAIRVDAPPRRLDVSPLPALAPAIAAGSLALSESWSPAKQEARIGEAQRRSIRIEAAGVDAGQLPEIRADVPGMTVHAEPPRLENRFRGELNVASREQTFTLVPQRGGELTVPELHLPWWNATTGAAANATLPARTLHVAGAAPLPAPAPAATPATAAVSTPSPLPAALAALLCAASLLVWIRRDAWLAAWLAARRLQRACRAGKAGAVRDALLADAARRWPDSPPLSLGALAERLADPAARNALAHLERSLYGPTSGACDRDALAAAMRLVRNAIHKKE